MERYSLEEKKKVHNTQGIIVFQMFYEIFIFFNMLLNIFKLAKIKVPLKCDYTFLVAFLFYIFPRVFKK